MGMASGLRGTRAGHGVRAFEPKLLKSGLYRSLYRRGLWRLFGGY